MTFLEFLFPYIKSQKPGLALVWVLLVVCFCCLLSYDCDWASKKPYTNGLIMFVCCLIISCLPFVSVITAVILFIVHIFSKVKEENYNGQEYDHNSYMR